MIRTLACSVRLDRSRPHVGIRRVVLAENRRQQRAALKVRVVSYLLAAGASLLVATAPTAGSSALAQPVSQSSSATLPLQAAVPGPGQFAFDAAFSHHMAEVNRVRPHYVSGGGVSRSCSCTAGLRPGALGAASCRFSRTRGTI